MSRSNVSKVKAKNQKKAKTSSSIQMMEKEFKNMPEKLIQQLRKDTLSLKKQELDLNLSLKKMQKQKKLMDSQQASLVAKSQEKTSKSIKKQLLAVKKNAIKLNKSLTTVTSDILKIQNQLSIASAKQAQFLYIKKEIAQLDKRAKTKSSTSPINSRKKLKPEMEPLQDTTQPIQELIDSTLSQIVDIES